MEQQQIDPEFNLEDEQEALLMEKRSKEQCPQLSQRVLPTRLYLEESTIPHVYEAMKALCKERPQNPIEFFSYYLLTHNPYKQAMQQQQEQQQFVQEELVQPRSE